MTDNTEPTNELTSCTRQQIESQYPHRKGFPVPLRDKKVND
jgi:hypothetical protein